MTKIADQTDRDVPRGKPFYSDGPLDPGSQPPVVWGWGDGLYYYKHNWSSPLPGDCDYEPEDETCE